MLEELQIDWRVILADVIHSSASMLHVHRSVGLGHY